MEERFCVHKIDPNKPEQLQKIVKSQLINQEMRTGSPRYAPLFYTVKHINELGARCVIHQRNIQDPDFLGEHAAYYSNWSTDVPRYCDRFHFFNVKPASNRPLDIIDQMAEQKHSYLGFLTLRPVSMSPVGASILRPKPHDNTCFLLSRDIFEVNLAGQTFEVNGTPFMQQDNAVGACAQASIWMALRTLRRKEGNAAVSLAEITSAATRFMVDRRTLPNRGGLRLEQITEAVRATGYSPHTIPLNQNAQKGVDGCLEDAKQALYPYVESGIPVLVVLDAPGADAHAVAVIGHGWTKEPESLISIAKISNEAWSAPIELFDASSWIEPFYIHNDNMGPYLQLPQVSPEQAKEPDNKYTLNNAVLAIPFLCPDVFIDGAEARETCLNLFVQALAQYGAADQEQDLEQEAFKLPNLVIRTYLQDKATFRRYVLHSNMSDDVKQYYREKWLPKRIWVTEINALENYHESPLNKAVRLGEVLLDPSSEPEDAYFLTIHLEGKLFPPDSTVGGVIIDRDSFQGVIQAFPVEGGEYTPIVRTMT